MNSIKLAIVEDDVIVAESLESYLQKKSEIELVAKCNSVESFLETLNKLNGNSPIIILLDIQLPGISGIEGIPFIRKKLPDVNIIMLTTFEDHDKIFSALCAGASSYLSKQSTLKDIFECILTVNKGGSYMSPGIARKVVQFFSKETKNDNPLSNRQLEIVNGIVEGLSYKMVGAKLDISLDTVRTHIMQIYRTLNIHSKGELIKWALENK